MPTFSTDSDAYGDSQLRPEWTNGTELREPIEFNPNIRMPDMRLVKITTSNGSSEYATGWCPQDSGWTHAPNCHATGGPFLRSAVNNAPMRSKTITT
jgi:hypothetical protein